MLIKRLKLSPAAGIKEQSLNETGTLVNQQAPGWGALEKAMADEYIEKQGLWKGAGQRVDSDLVSIRTEVPFQGRAYLAWPEGYSIFTGRF